MKKYTKIFALILGVIIIILGFINTPAQAQTKDSNAFNKSLPNAASTFAQPYYIAAGIGQGNVQSFFTIFIYMALVASGTIFIILTVYGGYSWLMAQGSDEKIKKSKEIITSALFGLIIILSAYTISYYIIQNATDVLYGSVESEYFESSVDNYDGGWHWW